MERTTPFPGCSLFIPQGRKREDPGNEVVQSKVSVELWYYKVDKDECARRGPKNVVVLKGNNRFR